MKEIVRKREMEGGCGVVGLASEYPVAGKHLYPALFQMHNRGNGKGGGLAACGCFPQYKEFYAVNLGVLKPEVKEQLEAEFIKPVFEVEKAEVQPSISDYRSLGLEIEPPRVYRYFARVKKEVLEAFARERGFKELKPAEDQLVYENSFRLNQKYYASLSDKAAFVLSHGKNLLVLKGVGYAEQFVQYYCLEGFKSPIWIGHQRYPTRGRVWHPGGAHPFVGLNEALVHNGDFANYFAVCEYLAQKDIYPLFLTDTEVSVLLFDHYARNLNYNLETIIEALAPTAERDFELLGKTRQRLYRAIRAAHLHGSPDGPWFFIIARYLEDEDNAQLIGITDTAMLRPHVFAYSGGEAKIGLVASEKQAIDTVLQSLYKENPQICPIAEKYWISRGGSHTDGGAFAFSLKEGKLSCADKFSKPVELPTDKTDYAKPLEFPAVKAAEQDSIPDFIQASPLLQNFNYQELVAWIAGQNAYACTQEQRRQLLELLTRLHDLYYQLGDKKRNWVQYLLYQGIVQLLERFPALGSPGEGFYRMTWENRELVASLDASTQGLVINAVSFPQEGEESVAKLIVRAYQKGIKKFWLYNLKGDRFIGCGLGKNSSGVRIEVYGSSGDYLGSGLDGGEIFIHGSAQDQLGQIMNSGKLVIYGDVGQTFLYGAKGGTVYVMGNCAGRPLINSVGKIRAVINGTCLDYAAESFMAGAEQDGGFILINGLRPNAHGEFIGLEEKYPGGNFFSLASGGAGYLNDPYRTVGEEQLNGAEFVEFTPEDWQIIEPYLEENQQLFGIKIERDLLTIDRLRKSPSEVFRKVVAKSRKKLEEGVAL